MKSGQNEILIEKMESLKELIEAKFDANANEHSGILAQTTKTNGRVTKLEDEQKDLVAWKNEVQGGFNVVKFIGIGNIIVAIAYLATLVK